MGLNIILLIAGLVLLIFGAEWLVRGASALAKKFKVSDLVIGLTVVAFGTSTPELVVNGLASFQGSHDIVMGN
ncbi:MAG TPA: sodium:calcium antiporter, partial [Mariniphaga sp.]|nr:sodium:calcium antiporter [Mariniphaga sp.]